MPLTYTKPAVRSAWADTPLNPATDVVDPGDTYVQRGWQLGVKPPRSYFNWLLNYASAGVRYLCQNGVAAWDPAELYPAGAVTVYAGVMYHALNIANNINNVPSSSPNAWGPLQTSTAASGSNGTDVANTAWVKGNFATLPLAFSSLSGQIANGQVPVGAVTQWQSSLAIAFTQLTGQIANGQVPVGAVTQWQSSLSIAWSQITGTKNADQLQGLVPAAGASANSIVQRDASGYIYAAYLNQASANSEGAAVNQVMTTNGVDNFLRKASLAVVLENMLLSAAVTLQADPGGTPANGTPGTLVAYY